jgi:hypothetical protein
VVSRRTRRFVHAFLLVFALCGLGRVELFPFSGFRLFSAVRSVERHSWQLRAVDASGEEIPIRLADLPVAYRNTSTLLRGFDDLAPAERDPICAAWATPLRDDGVDVVAVRIYELVTTLRPDAPPPQRSLAYECGRTP